MTTTQAIERVRDVMRCQHKALSTEETYLFWLRRYIRALGQMPSGLSSEKKLEQFLTDLARKYDVSASSQNQAFNAILFFYRDVLQQRLGNVNALRAQRPVHLRHAPTLADTKLLLQTIRNVGGYPTNLIARGDGAKESCEVVRSKGLQTLKASALLKKFFDNHRSV